MFKQFTKAIFYFETILNLIQTTATISSKGIEVSILIIENLQREKRFSLQKNDGWDKSKEPNILARVTYSRSQQEASNRTLWVVFMSNTFWELNENKKKTKKKILHNRWRIVGAILLHSSHRNHHIRNSTSWIFNYMSICYSPQR